MMEASPSHILTIFSFLAISMAGLFGVVTRVELSQREQLILFGSVFIAFTFIVVIYRLMVRTELRL